MSGITARFPYIIKIGKEKLIRKHRFRKRRIFLKLEEMKWGEGGDLKLSKYIPLDQTIFEFTVLTLCFCAGEGARRTRRRSGAHSEPSPR